MGAIVRGPLKMGLLTGKFTPRTTFAEGDIRANWPNEPWFRESLETVQRLQALVGEGETLGQLALRFVLSHPAVSAAIPGGKTPEQVEVSAAASRRPLLSKEELRVIEEISPAP